MSSDDSFTQVLSELDAEIAATEAQLADLRLQRKGAEAFLARLARSGGPRVPAEARTQVEVTYPDRKRHTPNGQSARVAGIFDVHPDREISVDEVAQWAREQDLGLDREQLRSALTYLRRTRQIESQRRGWWKKVKRPNDFGPAATSTAGPTEAERDDPASQVDIPQGTPMSPQPAVLSVV